MIKRLLFLVNTVCIVALLFAYTAPYIAPSSWYIPQLFGLFYNYILLANVAFFLFWLFFKKSYAKYSFLAILIGFGFISRAYKWNGNMLKSEQNVAKLLTYNVKKFGTDNAGKTRDPTPLFQFVQEQHATVICVQEYSHSRYRKYGSKLLGKTYPHMHFADDLATFSKYPIVKKERIEFEKKQYAAAIFTDIAIQTDTLRIVNVHLQSNQLSATNKQDIENLVSKKRKLNKLRLVGRKLKNASLHRVQQVEKLVNLIENSPYPILLCGDFNDTPLSYSYQRIKNLLDDSFVVSGKKTGRTFAEGSIKVRIDYVFSKRSFYEHQVHTVNYSDHKPISVLFDLNLE